MRLFLKSFVMTCLFVFPAQAQQVLPEGATLLNISATERQEIAQDLLVANLRIEQRLSDPKELQQEINKSMKKALKDAAKFEDVEVQTAQYYVYQEYNHKNKDDMTWRANQGMILKSKNKEQILELSGQLQDMGFLMEGLNYQVAPETYEAARENLLEAAIEKLLKRAHRVGSAIDKPNTDLWEINVDAAPSMTYPQQPMMMARGAAMMEMDQAAAPPMAEAGTSQVSMSVSAKILLK